MSRGNGSKAYDILFSLLCVAVLISMPIIAVVCWSHFNQQNLPAVVIDQVTWTQILYWDFKDGFYPQGWGYGNWSIVEGKLEGQDLTGDVSVYFVLSGKAQAVGR